MDTANTVAVVGAGIIGLTTATRLVEEGYTVHLYTDKLPEGTTSMVAAGLWYPYKVEPLAKALPWSEVSLRVFREQAQKGMPGVRVQPMVEYFYTPKPDPDWAPLVEGFHWLPNHQLPEPFQAGASFRVPIADTGLYLPWLLQGLQKAGVSVVVEKVKSLTALSTQYPIVVNCTGLGSRDLVGDQELYPIQGQVKKLAPLPDSTDQVLLVDDAGTLIYVIPRLGDTVVGGTAVEGSWEETVDEALARELQHAAVGMYPSVAGLATLHDQVGLRPGRTEVRLETERLTNGHHLVHNYGHGGAGITLCWGCAEEVCSLLRQI